MKDRPAKPTAVWQEPRPVNVPGEILRLAGGHRLLAEGLVRRGITNYQQGLAFLDSSQYTPAPPGELPDLEKAASRLGDAIRRNERIGVWGDFDVDGQTSTTLLVEVLKGLGGDVLYHIPVRARESHGVNLPGLEAFLNRGVQVVLTCDTGVTAHEAAAYARSRGVDFIITDHHTLPPVLPDAFAVVNPQRLPEGHPLGALPGVGTAYKLAEELACRAGRLELAEHVLDLVAMGNVADMAILRGDARYLVQRGLAALREPVRIGIQSILDSAETDPANLSEEHISFILAPRLNAIGRLDDANPIVDFLTTTDLTLARITAARLEGLNNLRKTLCDQVFMAALAQIERKPELLDNPVLLLDHPQWPAGVIGIVASRLVELYHRPVVLISTPPGGPGHGSARSVEGINITSAIAANQQLLFRFGGHPMAAGLSIDPERIPELRRGLARAVASQAEGKDLSLTLPIEAFITLPEINLELVEHLARMAPFGPGNPAPVLAARGLTLESSSFLGRSQEHVQLLVQDADHHIQRVVWWQGGGAPLPQGHFDLAFTVRSSNFRGQPEVTVEYAGVRLLDVPIDLGATTPVVQAVDLRQEPDPEKFLSALQQQGGLLIWQEGENMSNLAGTDRCSLVSAPVLAIWSIPPGRAELDRVLQAVQPGVVYFCAVRPSTDVPVAFLNRLAGLVRHALKEKNGQVPLIRLAAATAQREITVRTGLKYLEARGVIQVIFETDGNLILLEGGKQDNQAASILEKNIQNLLKETAAFRDFYQRADADVILAGN